MPLQRSARLIFCQLTLALTTEFCLCIWVHKAIDVVRRPWASEHLHEALLCVWDLEDLLFASRPHHFESGHWLHNMSLVDCGVLCPLWTNCPQTCHYLHDNAKPSPHLIHSTFQMLSWLEGCLLRTGTFGGEQMIASWSDLYKWWHMCTSWLLECPSIGLSTQELKIPADQLRRTDLERYRF